MTEKKIKGNLKDMKMVVQRKSDLKEKRTAHRQKKEPHSR
jgi:hypothetical protein